MEEVENGIVEIMYNCPPAKAIGAIGMREDTMPDIVVLVEDDMAKALFMALKSKYIQFYPNKSYLDIRVLEIGGYQNVISFYTEASQYVFYDNVYLIAYMDKDVETDIIPYPQFGNKKEIETYHRNSRFLKFLPYTPEVLLAKIYTCSKRQFLQKLKREYNNQQLDYSLDQLDFSQYESDLPHFDNQNDYNTVIGNRGTFRSKCKKVVANVAQQLAEQLNITKDEIYRFSFNFAMDSEIAESFDVHLYLSQMMERIR